MSLPKKAAALSKIMAAWYLNLHIRIRVGQSAMHWAQGIMYQSELCLQKAHTLVLKFAIGFGTHPMSSLISLTTLSLRYGVRARGVLGLPISAFSRWSHSFLTCNTMLLNAVCHALMADHVLHAWFKMPYLTGSRQRCNLVANRDETLCLKSKQASCADLVFPWIFVLHGGSLLTGGFSCRTL